MIAGLTRRDLQPRQQFSFDLLFQFIEMRRHSLRQALGFGFDALINKRELTRWLLSHPSFESYLRRRNAAQEPLGGWPSNGMSLTDRFRLLGEALQSNCHFLRSSSRPLLVKSIGGLAPELSIHTDENEQPSALRIFSLNTWCSHFLGGPRRAERLQLVIDHLETVRYDLVVFQELFTFGIGFRSFRFDGEQRWMATELRRLGYIHSSSAATATNAPWFGQDSGLCAFSRWPLVGTKVDRFSNSRRFSQKGTLRFKLSVPSNDVISEMQLHVTHLEHSDKCKQARQVRELLDGVGVVAGETTRGGASDEKVCELVLGDMNICAGKYRGPMYEMLHNAMAAAGFGSNLAANLQWTCDLSMAQNPVHHRLNLLTEDDHAENLTFSSHRCTRASPTMLPFGCTIDHAWLSTSWAKFNGAHCTVVQLIGEVFDDRSGEKCAFTASDHLGLVIELPLSERSQGRHTPVNP
eukprot:SAG31_NODE_634_length_13365_cov_182.161767_3_plen_465_part_00